MARVDSLRIALALAIALGIAAVFGAVSMSQDRPGLPVGDLVRIGAIDDATNPVIVDHVAWSFDLFAGTDAITETDLDVRFAPSFSAGFTAEDLNASIREVNEMFGSIDFVRYHEWDASVAEAIGVNSEGIPFLVPLEVASDGRIVAWGLDDLPSPPRVPGWQAGLVLLSVLSFIAAAFSSVRVGRKEQARALVGGAVASASGVLVMSNAAGPYSVGRVLAPGVVLIAIWLLLRLGLSKAPKLAMIGGGVGAALLALAPLTRDATLLGHPAVALAWTDSAAIYRWLLVGGSGLVALSLIGVAVVKVRQLRMVRSARRSPLAAAALVALVWGLALLLSAVDFVLGDGVFAASALHGIALGSLATVPPVVAFQTVTSRWDRPELAELVIDLEAGDLQRAAANALDDPAVRVLTSPDGQRLVDDSGLEVSAHVGDRQLARIQSGGILIGGLLLGTGSTQHPERLSAVTAAVGMALEVGRLNQRVTAQLEEVEASRSRIVEASDEARRRVERDLHDGAQQRLVALGLELQRARRIAGKTGHSDLEQLLESATQSVRDTIEDVRSVSRGSDPPLLTERGLSAAIDALVERAPIPVAVDVADSIPAAVERTSYFVVAEGLTNVAKHAGARQAQVRVTRRERDVVVEVVDDGVGGADVAAGTGLQGLQDRTAAANGSFQIDSSPAGTTIRAVLPCG